MAYNSVQDKAKELKFSHELDKTHKSFPLTFGMNLFNGFKTIPSIVKFKFFMWFLCKMLGCSSIAYMSVQKKAWALKLDKRVKSCVSAFGKNSIDSVKIIHSTKKKQFFVCFKMGF